MVRAEAAAALKSDDGVVDGAEQFSTAAERRAHVVKKLWQPMMAVAVSFIVTLAVFPGVTASIPSAKVRSALLCSALLCSPLISSRWPSSRA